MNQLTPNKLMTTDRKEGHLRFKVTYDLNEALDTCVQDIATDLGCSQSDVVAHLLVAGIAQYQTGKLNLRAIRRPHSFQLRFAYKLPPPSLRLATPVDVQGVRSGEGG